ncbi:hypothetical protein [Ancylobacter sp.]|uniref:hypothetical protein n=1 Tax=Ancylobacter sp. TaxID=1872567 RepID=UPI003C7B1DF8
MSKNYVDISDSPTLWKTKDLPKSRVELPVIIRSKRSSSVYIRLFIYLISSIFLIRYIVLFTMGRSKIPESKAILLFEYSMTFTATILFLYALFYVLFSMIFIIKQYLSTDPIIIIDEQGIIDSRIRKEPFTWESIKKIDTVRPDINFESMPAGLQIYLKDGNIDKIPLSANWTISLFSYVEMTFSRRLKYIPVSLVSTTQSRHVVMSVIEHFLDPYGLRR